MNYSYFNSSIRDFLLQPQDEILGKLNRGNIQFKNQWNSTNISWEEFIYTLHAKFSEIIIQYPPSNDWHLIIEYEIPRLGKRIDAVILADDLVFIIEYKFNRDKFSIEDLRQVETYAIELLTFHKPSQNKSIIPILLSPEANTIDTKPDYQSPRIEIPIKKANRTTFSNCVLEAFQAYSKECNARIINEEWMNGEYHPTPVIIEAAQSLFAGKKIDTITRHGAKNIEVTSKYLIEEIRNAKENNKKSIFFITGVPGAGKTLVGLNIVHEKKEFGGTDNNTAYFSGNSPLINVLRESLSRDHYTRKMKDFQNGIIKKRPRKEDSYTVIEGKIQNLHKFIKDGLGKNTPLSERIAVFDEAQRCWTGEHLYNKTRQNQNRENRIIQTDKKSEAELLLEFMNRQEGWSIIIALIGNGQEINTGEGGLYEWGKALKTKYRHWEIHMAENLIQEFIGDKNHNLFNEPQKTNLQIQTNSNLHLEVSHRQFKAASLNAWVNAMLDNNLSTASKLAQEINPNFPLFITRDLSVAKKWLSDVRSSNERSGILASSGGLRLKPMGINVREVIDETLWFLNDENDIRSSSFLELAATEFKVQGLEIDWACICWDGDFRRLNANWDYNSFSGTSWNKSKSALDQKYILNTYRVLLTRARNGIIVYVPLGDVHDKTRLPEIYDHTYEYLLKCGMLEII